jgi:hypothetical protein
MLTRQNHSMQCAWIAPKCRCLSSHLVRLVASSHCVPRRTGVCVHACGQRGSGGRKRKWALRYKAHALHPAAVEEPGREREGDRVHLYTPLTIELHPAATALHEACTCRSFGRFSLLPRPVAGRGRRRRGGVAFAWRLGFGGCFSCFCLAFGRRVLAGRVPCVCLTVCVCDCMLCVSYSCGRVVAATVCGRVCGRPS